MRGGLFGWKTTVNSYNLPQRELQVAWFYSRVRELLPLPIANLDFGIDVTFTGDYFSPGNKLYSVSSTIK